MKAMKIPGNRIIYGILSISLLGLFIYLIGQTNKSFEYSNILNQTYADSNGSDLSRGKYFQSDYSSKEETSENGKMIGRQIEAEGAVLIKNKDAALPLADGLKVSCFSRSSVDFIYTGTGSSTIKLNSPITLRDALENDGLKVNPILWSRYLVETVYRTSGVMEDPSSSYKMNVGESDIEVLNEIKVSSSIDEYNQVGIITISRINGEGYDLPQYNYTNGRDGFLTLTEKEREMISFARKKCQKLVVLLNTSNPFELGFLDEYDIDACLWVGFPGQYGLESVSDILVGKISPSGRLADTYAYSSHSSPANVNSGDFSFIPDVSPSNEYDTRNNYLAELEGIYVGYKYYETRYEDTIYDNNFSRSPIGAVDSDGGFKYQEEVIYPFGYGLSYTSFSQKIISSGVDSVSKEISLNVQVENTGTCAGKDTIMVFHQSEYTESNIINKLEKSSVNLVGFYKTPLLAPGAKTTEKFTLSFEDLSSYDYIDNQGYVLTKGNNYISIGDDVHDGLDNILSKKGIDKSTNVYMTDNGDPEKCLSFYNSSDLVFDTGAEGKVSNQFSSADITKYYPDRNIKYFSRSDYESTFPMKLSDLPITPEISMMTDDDYTFQSGEAPRVEFDQDNGYSIADFNSKDYSDPAWEELLDQLSEDEMIKLVSKGGFAVNYVKSINSPLSYDRDGPLGISSVQASVSSGTLYPSEVVMASTFNSKLLEDLGTAIGEEAMYLNVTGWYAPEVNIHRNVFGGRNFEYFSEDSYLSGMMAASEIKGAQSKGLIVNLKHFALNDQEIHRNGICIFNNEQAIREIYLKPFEIGVKNGKAMGVMSSFTRIGTIWSGAHKGLLTNVLRNEWGFKGRVVTDYTEGKNFMSIKSGLAAGNDLWLCSTNTYYEDLTAEAAEDPYILSLIRKAAKNILFCQSHSSAINRYATSEDSHWKVTIIYIDLFTGLLFIASCSAFIIQTIQINKAKKKI